MMKHFSKMRSIVIILSIGSAATVVYSSCVQTGNHALPPPATDVAQPAGTQAANAQSDVTAPRIQREPRAHRTPEIDQWMAGIREAGLHGDRSRIPEMIAALEHPKHPDMIKTALHALAHLGAVEALPAIDVLIRNERTDPDDRNYAIAARARLVAEYTSASAPDPTTRTGAKVNRLQREMGLSGERLTAAARSYGGGSRFYRLPPAEVYAMRQLADIAYREHYSTPNGIPGTEGIDFSQDPASAIKVKLALLPESQRAVWLIQDLAHSTQRTEIQPYEIQLAIDEGQPASRAAGLQLQEMEKHRNQYAFNGFAALSELMRCVGDKSELPLLEHLSHDPDPRLASFWGLAYNWVFYGPAPRVVYENGY